MTVPWSDGLPDELKKLGEVLSVHKTGIALHLYIACAFLLMGGGFCAIGVGSLFVAPQGGGDLLGWRMVLAGLLWFAFGIVTLRKGWRKPQSQVFVFHQAMACVERGEVEIIRWEDVNCVRRVDGCQSDPYRVPGEGVYQLFLDRRDGRQFVFNESLSRFPSFCRLVREHTLRHMLPLALQAYEMGATVGFGDVSISPEGIHYSGDMLPWDLFERAETSKGRLFLYSRHGWKPFGRVELSQVPNAHVLVALAEHAHTRRY